MNTYRIQVTPRATQLTIVADASLERPFAVGSEGAEPVIRERGDAVEIEYSFAGRVRAASSRRGSLTVTLNPSYAWEIDLRGGVSGLRADLSGLDVSAISVGGGASDIAIDLPAPHGELPLRIEGGVSRARSAAPATRRSPSRSTAASPGCSSTTWCWGGRGRTSATRAARAARRSRCG